MESKKYILNGLEILIAKFPNVRVRYEYDKYALIHFVEVVPNNVYHLSNDYIAWENDMTGKFIEIFPTENICFISDDALVCIENEEFILYGADYAPVSTYGKEQEMITVDKNFISISLPSIYAVSNEINVEREYPINYFETYLQAA